MKLSKEKLDFQISFVGGGKQTNFDQNKYYSFKLHKYTNIDNNDLSKPALAKSRDIAIAMVPCKSNN